MDEGSDKSAHMMSSESPIIMKPDTSIPCLSKACERGENESKRVISLLDDLPSGEIGVVSLGQKTLNRRWVVN